MLLGLRQLGDSIARAALVLVFIVAMMGDPQQVAQGAMARPRRDRQMPDEPQRLAIIECTVCNACLDIYRYLQDGEEHLDWQMRDADLCPHPPLHRCPQARLEVRRRFPDEHAADNGGLARRL